MIPSAVFLYIFALITVGFSLYIVFSRNLLYSAFALLGTLLGVSALYVFAGADFIALTQIIIYVGGILVLIMFGIMLTGKVTGTRELITGLKNPVIGIVAGILIFAVLVLAILKANFATLDWISKSVEQEDVITESTFSTIGKGLMTTYLLPFEIAAIFLLAALIGAAYIASGKVKGE